MSNSEDFFQDNPWGAIDKPCYPAGRRLYLHDERFWVSMDANRHLLFFVQEFGGESIRPLENLAGLAVSIEKQANGKHRLVCKLTSTQPDLEEKFATVAKDIAYHCSGYSGRQVFLRTQDRISSWANFLRPSRQGLSHSEFVGLFGELYVLSEYLLPLLTVEDSIKAWIGPEGKKQDFVLNDWAIEVKTTIAGDQQTIRISSLDQLDRVTEKLYLLRIVASPAAAGDGVTIATLYSRCLESLFHDVVARGLFLQKVSALYGKANESQIEQQFRVSQVSLFDVVDGFPKLTQKDVKQGVVNAKYEIAVGSIASYQIEQDFTEILGRG